MKRATASCNDDRSYAEKIVAIEEQILLVPKGYVSSYSAVAKAAGCVRGHRLTTRALAMAAKGKLPWHRILRTDGKIGFAQDSENYARQRDLLLAEGITVINGKVNMQQYAWCFADQQPSLDQALWALPDDPG